MTALQRRVVVPWPDAAASVSSVICVILSAAVWPRGLGWMALFTVVATAPASDAAAVGAYAQRQRARAVAGRRPLPVARGVEPRRARTCVSRVLSCHACRPAEGV